VIGRRDTHTKQKVEFLKDANNTIYIYIYIYSAWDVPLKLRNEGLCTWMEMVTFMEDTSPMWITEETPRCGTYAPPSTPVEYFNQVYGPGDTDANGGAECWMEAVAAVTANIACTEVIADQEGGRITTEKNKEGEASSRDKVNPRLGVKEGCISKKPRGRQFRGCARCGTRNHHRRLFCEGCYGSKDVMKGKRKD